MLFGKKSYKKISPSEAKSALESNKNAVLVDVRTPDEYRQGHIPHSKLVPLNNLDSGIAKVAKDKDTELIVYCLSGARAASACSILSSMGYTNVSNLGGIQFWPYEIVRGNR